MSFKKWWQGWEVWLSERYVGTMLLQWGALLWLHYCGHFSKSVAIAFAITTFVFGVSWMFSATAREHARQFPKHKEDHRRVTTRRNEDRIGGRRPYDWATPDD